MGLTPDPGQGAVGRARDKAEVRDLCETALAHVAEMQRYILQDKFDSANFELDFGYAYLDLVREKLDQLS